MKQLTIAKQITNRDSQSLDKYLQEIGKVDLLTPDEEVDLTQRIREGDVVALEKLTKANLRFVVSVAKQYHNNKMTLGDMISEGNMGLMKAALRFDETRGFKFISYAVWWIRQSIIQAMAEQSRVVRLPLNRVSSYSKISKNYSILEQEYQREPTSEELAEAMEMPMSEIENNISISSQSISIDAPFIQGESNSLLDVLENQEENTPDSELIQDSLRNEINLCLSSLTKREAYVISMYFGLNRNKTMTLEDIGEKLDLTRERVRQIKEKATRKLRNSKNTSLLKQYL